MENLVSHGKDVEGKNACYGVYDSSTKIGWGPGFQNSCIHSGSNDYSGGDTVWYNYALASAGTIIDENTTEENPVTNTNPATESICPKGWTLPSTTQAQAIGPKTGSTTYVASFSPVLGGNYVNGTLYYEDTRGFWWGGSTVSNGAVRYGLYYDGSSLYNGTYSRLRGTYIRCVPKS